MELRAENISKRYFRKTGGANYFYAVQPVSFSVPAGEVTVLTGRSGSGKTTLLHMLAGLLTPTEGKVYLGKTDLYSLPDAALSRLRNEQLGVIAQGRSAIDTLTVWENILLPARLYGREAPEAEATKYRRPCPDSTVRTNVIGSPAAAAGVVFKRSFPRDEKTASAFPSHGTIKASSGNAARPSVCFSTISQPPSVAPCESRRFDESARGLTGANKPS